MRRRPMTPRKGTFDTDDLTKVKHTKIGVWDFYQDVLTLGTKSHFSWRIKLHFFDNFRKCIPEHYLEAVDSLPYVWLMLRDIAALRECWMLLSMYLVVELLLSLIPAVSLWYSSQLLSIVESAIETRSVDPYVLLSIAVARIACASVTRLLRSLQLRLSTPLNSRIKLFYNIRLFSAITRLDVPTFTDPIVQRQIEYAIPPNSRSSIAWDTVVVALRMAGAVVQLLSQLSVLVAVLRNQRDGPLLAVLSFGQTLFGRNINSNHFTGAGVWAATTSNKDYILTEGLKRTINDPVHRQEIVAGNLGDYLVHQYRTSITRLGEDANDFWNSMTQYRRNKQAFSYVSFLQDPLRELPQIVFTFRALTHPRTIPLTLASLNLITSTTQSFTHILIGLLDQCGSVADRLVGVRRLYEVGKIRNMVEDAEERKAPQDKPTKVYPQDKQTLSGPLSIEFIHVSFQYPGSTSFALDDVSFTIKSGQLCVILGPNGSGKSTVLKLITRLHDPTGGEITVNGLDIREWPLRDLRRATSVLFQDYTLFPLSIAENIALGGPPSIPPKFEEASLLASTATSASSSPPVFSTNLILEAARLGGSLPLISRLSGVDKIDADSSLIEDVAALQTGLEAYLDRPVKDFYSSLPEGTMKLFGRAIESKRVSSGGLGGPSGQVRQGASGGEMQRIALSRTFMRSLVADPGQDVGLFLFDEPSASLDPKAEHDLFERLRSFRGNKTMLFSSHRFGNLTRHADMILCMEDSVITETGTHAQLMEKDGEYARVWKLQAQAFLGG